MTRKVLTIGRSSYAITLPRSFVKEHDLQPGDDLHVTHEANAVHIRKHQTEHTISADLEGFKAAQLRDMRGFSLRMLKTFFLSGAQRVHLKNLDDPLRKQLQEILSEARFYQENIGSDSDLRLVCPVTLTAKKTEEQFVKSTLQLLYRYLTQDDNVLRGQLQDHLDQTRRAISQNLQSKKDLALYSFIEKIELVVHKLSTLEERPSYADALAKTTYYLQRTYATQEFPNLKELIKHVHLMMDAEAQAEGQEQADARQLRIYMEHASTNLVIHNAPA